MGLSLLKENFETRTLILNKTKCHVWDLHPRLIAALVH